MAESSIGFASNYTYLHMVKNAEGQWLYLGPGISSIEAENEDETDDTAYYDSKGAKPEDVTGVKIGYSVSGHRYNGDPAQDYIAGLLIRAGEDRVTDFRRIAPDGAMLEGPVTIKDIVDGGGEANEKAAFECSITYRQMPAYTPPSSRHMPEKIEFDGELSVDAGQTLDLSSKVKVTPEDATPNCVFCLDDESLDGQLAMIDDAGVLTAKAQGKVRVTAKCISKPALTATAEVTINQASEAVSLDASSGRRVATAKK